MLTPAFEALDRVAAAIAGCTVAVRGVDIRLSAVPAWTSLRIAEALPLPTPPRTRKDPHKGSLAELLPDYDDPAYRAALGETHRLIDAAHLRVAMGDAMPVETGPLAAWAKEGAEKLYGSLTAQELGELLRRLRELNGGPRMERDALEP